MFKMNKNEYMEQETEGWAHFNIRCVKSLRDEAEASAKEQGQSLAEWIRRAIQEKLDREKNQTADDDLDARIEAVLRKMLAEAKQ